MTDSKRNQMIDQQIYNLAEIRDELAKEAQTDLDEGRLHRSTEMNNEAVVYTEMIEVLIDLKQGN